MMHAKKGISILAGLSIAYLLGGCSAQGVNPTMRAQNVLIESANCAQNTNALSRTGDGGGQRTGIQALVRPVLGDGGGQRTGIQALVRPVPGDGGGQRTATTLAKRIGDGGGQSPAIYGLDGECSNLVAHITGDTENTDSVLVTIDGQEFSITVDANGHFEALIPVSEVPQNVILTAYAGEIAGMAVDASALLK
ncbi:MAG: hypothetical protein V1798_00500 [Pseudomonadota bacterium]